MKRRQQHKNRTRSELQRWGAASVSLPGGLAYVPSTNKYWTIAERKGRSMLGWFDKTNFGSAIDTAKLHDSGLFLTSGFWRGLTYDVSRERFYALHASGFGAYEVRELDPESGMVTNLLTGPRAAFGGLTSLGGGMLTALFAADPNEGFRMYRIDLESRRVTPFGESLGVMMNGGLKWDGETNSQYFAVGGTDHGDWMIYAIAADGSSAEPVCLLEESAAAVIEWPEMAMAASRS